MCMYHQKQPSGKKIEEKSMILLNMTYAHFKRRIEKGTTTTNVCK